MPRIEFRQNFSDSLNMLKLFLLDRFVRFVARINCCSNTIDYPRLTLKIYSYFRLKLREPGALYIQIFIIRPQNSKPIFSETIIDRITTKRHLNHPNEVRVLGNV